jgi:hypothetical protein
MRERVFAGALLAMALMLSPASANAEWFGAIAYSPSTGAQGYSYDYPDRWSAENRALQECNARSGGCRVAVWFRNACGALAVGNSGWGSGWGNNQRRAEAEALGVCRRHSRGCSVVRWVCTSR